MKMIDMHCDTAMKLLAKSEKHLKKNDWHVDYEKLKKSNSFVQFFAYFIHLEAFNKYGFDLRNEMELVREMHKRFTREVHSIEGMYILKEMKDLDESKIGALLTLEGAGCVETLKDVDELYDMGIRLITLTWNWNNRIARPNVPKDNMDQGLTEFGIEAVKRMNELGIIIDVSHLSDAGFWDVIKYSTKPFVASHSNARKIGKHVRNLTDEMIKALAEKGGVTGLNFCSAFLTKDTEAKKMYIKDLVAHIKHIVKVGGIDVMALGTDFDGIGGDLEIKDIGEMHLLAEALKEEGFSKEDIEKIWYKNALRVMKEVL